MSTVHQLAARLNGGADQIPVELVIDASDQLSGAAELLAWVRGESPRPMGLPELSGAIEHLEHAAFALAAARECITEYVIALGLTASAEGRTPERRARGGPKLPPTTTGTEPAPDPRPLARWWSVRVDELTEPAGDRGADQVEPPAGRPRSVERHELLRTVARVARDGDRQSLRAELRDLDAPAGLALASTTPTELRALATDLLGKPPTSQDLAALRRVTSGRVRELLPGLPDEVPATLLGRVCRARTDRSPGATGSGSTGSDSDQPLQIHPADSAIAGAVLVGILAARLGRDPAELATTPAEENPAPAPDERSLDG